MKTLYLILFFSCTATFAQVQKMDKAKIGGSTAINASAALEVESTTQGFLLPRMTTAQRTAIATPAAGLQVYDTDLNAVWLYNGTAWLRAGGAKFVDGTNPLNAVYTAGSVGIGGQPNASAALDITSTTKGVLLPRMTTAERNLIASPANGLMIFNTTDNAAQVYSTTQQRWGSYNASTIQTYSTTVTTPEFSTYKENGTSGVALAAGALGQINFRGWDATRAAFIPAFRIAVDNLAAESTGNIPTSINFTHQQVGGPGGFNRPSSLFLSTRGTIGVNNITPHASAQLDVTSTTRGFLPPRMTNIQMLAITAPAEGLVVYCTNCTPKGLRVFDGAYWTDIIGTSPASKILYQWDFGGTTPLNNLNQENPSGISVVTDPLNSANKVLKTIILQGSDRTELSLGTGVDLFYYYADASPGFTNRTNTIISNMSLGHEFWISLKILKPQEQNTNGIKPCLFQIGPVSNLSLFPTSGSTGFWQLRVRNGTTPNGDSWNSRLFGNNQYTPLANEEVNFVGKSPNLVWEKFVIHCKYSATNSGILEVWKDGIKYINLTGQNAYAMNRARIKFGLYLGMGSSASQDLTAYFDDIKIGGANCSYEEISQ